MTDLERILLLWRELESAGADYVLTTVVGVAVSYTHLDVYKRQSVDHAIETGPKGGAHAHGARFAGGVERVAGERNRLELLGGFANGTHFSVGAGVELLLDGVESAQ